jgi:hypothetical protein
MSSPARCGPLLDGVGPIRTIDAPSLFVVSPGDMLGAVEKQVRELYAASGAPNKRLLIDDSGYHGTDMLRQSTHRAELATEVLRFIDGCFPKVAGPDTSGRPGVRKKAAAVTQSAAVSRDIAAFGAQAADCPKGTDRLADAAREPAGGGVLDRAYH